ncbi:MAG: family 65 glycosyl hydrolase domain-containing protein [Burkholderiales bacterium]
MKRIVKQHPYKIIIEEFKNADMRYLESVMSLSNGYMGMRGSFEEGSAAPGLKGTYIAGVWYPDRTRVGWWKNGYPDFFGKAVNALNLIDIDVYANGARVLMSEESLVKFYCELDMRQSVLKRSAVLASPCGNITVESQRFLSFDMKHICAIRYKVTASEAVSLSLMPHIDFDVFNESANYNEKLMNAKCQSFQRGIGYIEGATKDNEFGKETFGVCAAMSVSASGEPDVKETLREGYAGLDMRFSLEAGQSAQIDKIVSVFTTRDGVSPGQEALRAAEEAAEIGYDALLERHVRKFSERMRGCDIELEGDELAQQGARYCIYQLASTFDGSDNRLNIGPKGMTGEKYGGAAYWDTDAFLIPFYLATHDQSVAKNLLKFRFDMLKEAKANAKKLGLKGALYPMVTFDGSECHNEWEITFEEIHRNGAVAYAIFNYATYTGDTEYLIKYGFPVLLEISRFWAGRVSWSDKKRAYVYLGVTGPNEYENNVNNNWYTNRIAKWCLDYTVFVAEEYKDALKGYTQQEIDEFRQISAGIYLPYDSEQGVFLQQDGWQDKELIKTECIPPGERPLWQHWSWDRILRSCFIKQADVVQGLYFLDDDYDRETVRRNFEYYEQFTVHESSLSAGIHSVVASRAGLYDKAHELFLRAARLDIDDLGNDTSDGLHITAMSGAWLAVVQGFAGMKTTGDMLEFRPYLPKQLTAYSFTVNYRGTSMRIEVSARGIKATRLSGGAVRIRVYKNAYLLNESCECALETDCG